MRVCNRSPWIKHLLFVDDNLIFINANGASARRLNEILQMYDEASGQRVNKEKSVIYLGTPEDHKYMAKVTLNIQMRHWVRSIWAFPWRLVDRQVKHLNIFVIVLGVRQMARQKRTLHIEEKEL
jgi:hypothetical protein